MEVEQLRSMVGTWIVAKASTGKSSIAGAPKRKSTPTVRFDTRWSTIGQRKKIISYIKYAANQVDLRRSVVMKRPTRTLLLHPACGKFLGQCVDHHPNPKKRTCEWMRLYSKSTCCWRVAFVLQNDFTKSWKTSAVSTTVWMVETKLCKLRGTSDTFV